MNGIFITLEGTEGVGKSTHAKLLKEKLTSLGCDVVSVREPGGSEIGNEVRDIVKKVRANPVYPETELFLFQAARAQLVRELIKPALEANKIVIADRFTDSTIAYQSWARGINLLAVEFTNRLATMGVRIDKTFLLTTPYEISKKRTDERGTVDRFELEGKAFFDKVTTGFLSIAESEKGRFELVDSTKTIEEVNNIILNKILKIVEERKNQ